MNAGEPQFAGNRALLELPKTGFLASRGAEEPHGRLPLKPGGMLACILSESDPELEIVYL